MPELVVSLTILVQVDPDCADEARDKLLLEYDWHAVLDGLRTALETDGIRGIRINVHDNYTGDKLR